MTIKKIVSWHLIIYFLISAYFYISASAQSCSFICVGPEVFWWLIFSFASIISLTIFIVYNRINKVLSAKDESHWSGYLHIGTIITTGISTFSLLTFLDLYTFGPKTTIGSVVIMISILNMLLIIFYFLINKKEWKFQLISLILSATVLSFAYYYH